MGVVIEFRGCEGVRVESDRVNFTIRKYNGENCSNGIVGSICLDDHRCIWYPVG
jgi:hypothetical protein